MTTHSAAHLARSREKIKQAWLLTWEHATHRPRALNRFVAIVSSRYSDTRVRTILEQYYVNNYLSIPEQFSYVKSKKGCPYKVQHCTVAVSEKLQQVASLPPQAPFSDSMIIGGNPWLWARIVHDLEAWIDEDGGEHLKWKERENLLWEGGKITSDWREDSLIRCD
ncbi:MAG: hypothetical protein ACREBG_29800 [Pyrinomonadaceae bacterium]